MDNLTLTDQRRGDIEVIIYFFSILFFPIYSLLPMIKSYAALGRTCAIAQEKPAISLAIAVFTTFVFFPLATK